MTSMTLDSMFDRRFAPRPVTARPATPASGSLRLTRRGRLVVVAVALLVAFVVGVFVAAAGSVATEQPGTPAPTRIVQVHEGDTLWGIASDLAAGGDVRTMMTTIEHLNAMSSGTVHIGQRLVVPAAK